MGVYINKVVNVGSQRGSAAEAGLLVAIVVVVVILVLTTLGNNLCRMLVHVATVLDDNFTITMTYQCGCPGTAYWNCHRSDDTMEVMCGCARRL